MALRKKSSPTPETSTTDVDDVILPPPPSVEVDVDTYSDNISSAQVDELSRPRRQPPRPDISGLPNAIGPDGFPIFVRGDRIVIERRASFLQGNPYLDTRTYKVESVDLVSGKVDLWDESLSQYATDNWRHGVTVGQVYKLSLGRLVSSKAKRGRPRKDKPTSDPTPTPTSNGEKRRRGRPKGTKNRSKDVIRAEKKDRDVKRAAKAQRRAVKKSR